MKTKPTLKEWLYDERMSTEAFAIMCDTTRQTISHIINDKHRVSISLAIKIWEKTDYKVALSSIYPPIIKMYPSIKKIRKEDIA